MADRFQISMMTPSKGRDYVTISISIFVKCGKCWVFANPVTYSYCNSLFNFLLPLFYIAILVAFVVPITLPWANQLNSDQKDTVMELFPWKIFLFLHRVILLITFFGKPWSYLDIFKGGVHFISLSYRIVAIVWLFVLVTYIGCRKLSQQETQDLPSTSEMHGRHEMVTGLSPSWLIPASTLEKSNIVTGTTLPFPKLPDSELVTGCCSSLKRPTC